MNNEQIQVYTDEETKRRIELAAAKYEVTMTQYCLEAIRQRLEEDDILEREQTEVSLKQDNLIADLRALREKILTRRGGQPIDINIVEQIREERDYELTGLR